jgi:hypothetical protein
MRSPKGETRRDRKSGLALVVLHRQDSRELGEVLLSLGFCTRASVRAGESARDMAAFLGCSRRTARRAATYARRLGEEVDHG